MSYRPICDVWILARPKVKYYGAYPSGFLSRARELLGITIDDPMLHVCGGRARQYPFRGFGPNDKTLEIDTGLEADFHHDVREPLPILGVFNNSYYHYWPAILADPPYSEDDAARYAMGAGSYPNPNALLKNCLASVRVGGRVGFLHYIWPRPPKTARSVACIGVIVGFGNRMRCYSVFERTA
jgi:hypothetical protein